MMNQLFQILDKKDKTIDISETLLLAPQISKSQRKIIKEVLFEFILATSRSLLIAIFSSLPRSYFIKRAFLCVFTRVSTSEST